MSRSNPKAEMPFKRTFRWNSDKGCLKYYDKDLSIDVDVELPFIFLLLDELSCVRGYDSQNNTGYYSNEVRSISNDILKVKINKGIVAEGLWNDIKGSIPGSKFCSSCYIAFYQEDKSLVIGRLQFTGAALGKWFEFKKSVDAYKCAIKIDGFTNEVQGKTEYTAPTFKSNPVSEETNNNAIELDKMLQDYFDLFFKAKDQFEAKDQTDDSEDNTNSPIVPIEEDDDLPF